MSNLFDFSDNQMSWLGCQNFIINFAHVADNANAFTEEDEEDWFFPQPRIDVPEDITARYKEKAAPALPPVVYFSGMDLNCKPFEFSLNLADFDSFDSFLESIERKYMYISVFDADNCDFELAQQVLDSEEIFDQIVDEYKSRI